MDGDHPGRGGAPAAALALLARPYQRRDGGTRNRAQPGMACRAAVPPVGERVPGSWHRHADHGVPCQLVRGAARTRGGRRAPAAAALPADSLRGADRPHRVAAAPSPRHGRRSGIILALAVFVVTMVFSASYTPYSADASAPAAFETLTVLCIAATILFAWVGRTGWMLAFAVLGYFARPTGLMVPGLLALGALALPREQRHAQWRRMAAALTVCLAAFVLYEKVFMPIAAEGLLLEGTPQARSWTACATSSSPTSAACSISRCPEAFFLRSHFSPGSDRMPSRGS